MEKEAQPQRKQFTVKGATLTENCIVGEPSVMGVLDRGGDCIFPGFFKKALRSFLVDGFIAVGHDWGDLPVAMPTKAEERGNKLYSEALFHSTQRAQDARTVCKERIDNDLSVLLSIGFMIDYTSPDSYKYFDGGDSLIAYAKEIGCDMDLFDTKSIKGYKGYCRGLLPGGCKDLFEWSIVPVPMNPYASATDVKSAGDLSTVTTERQFEEFLREAGYSRSQAVAIASKGFKAGQRDAGTETPDTQPLVTASARRELEITVLKSRLADYRELAGVTA